MKNEALVILNTLVDNGYHAHLIGGSIRNEQHNKFHGEKLSVKDYDITTNASYDEVGNLFPNVDTRGEQFKVAVVKLPFSNNEFEVAQYRGESYPEGGSLRPNIVYAVKTLQEDVKRRDFTINGIAEDRHGNIVDLVGGVEDIKNKIIRAIGDANQRFAEDPLRMLRAVRFVSQLGYDIEDGTKEGIKANLDRLSKIPHERVKEEINKLLKGKHIIKALELMRELKFHKYTFYNSILKKNVYLFKEVLDQSENAVEEMYNYLYYNQEIALTDIYFVLYLNADFKKSVVELNDMMLLNNDDIFKVSILLKHWETIVHNEQDSLLNLVRDIGEQRGMSYLEEVLGTYGKLLEYWDLKHVHERILFKYQLPFNGTDVAEAGEKIGITQKGKWIGQVLDAAQEKEINGQNYKLIDLIEGVLGVTKT